MPAPAARLPEWSAGKIPPTVPDMNESADARGAIDLVVTKIVAEADSEGVSLSAVERGMLYFSESAPTLPDIMEVNEAFERDYDRNEYEKKIAQLIGKAKQRVRRADKWNWEDWCNAIRALEKQDYYLLLMINQAGASVRPRGDLLKLFGAGLLIVLGFLFWLLFFADPR
jgi:hypothetical protein